MNQMINFYFVLTLFVLKAIHMKSIEDKIDPRLNKDLFIIGGTDAVEGEAPFQVGLYEDTINDKGPFCGGSILDRRSLITAAHCCYQLEKDTSYIGYGSIYSDDSSESVGVHYIRVHSEYNSSTLDNDICIVRVKPEFQLNENRASIIHWPSCQYDDPSAGAVLHMTGWGTTGVGNEDSQPNRLQISEIPIMSRQDCRKKMGTNPTINTVTDNMICAQNKESDTSTCHYDSGGPLFVKIDPSNALLVGISSKSACGRQQYPSVFTRVHNYREWIRDNLL